MSKKLTLDINFIDTPRDGDKFGYQISNNGVPLSFNGFDGWDKTFKGASDYSIAAGSIMAFEADLTPSVSDNSDIGAGFDSYVNVIKTQSNGKYICVGGFTSYQGTSLSSRRICRLNTDFTLDTTFTPPDFPVYVECMEIDSNDKIYVGSNNVISGKGRLVRLNANGTIDTAYMPGIGFDRPVTAIKLQPDGKLIVAGLFTTFNSTPRKGIVRLTTGGIFDTTFNGVTTGFATVQDYPRSIAVQSTGRIIVGGDFYSYNGTPCRNTIIINANGSAFSGPAFLDNSPSGPYGANVLKVLVDSLDRIYVCGKFTRIANSSTVQRIIRLTSLGIEDTGFNVSASGLTNGTTSLTLGGFDMIINSNDDLVVVGNFTNAANQPFTNIAVYSDTGAISPDSEFGTGTFTATGAPVIYSLVQVGTKYIVGGTFNSYSTTDVAPVSSQFVIPIPDATTIDFGSGYENLVSNIYNDGTNLFLGGGFQTYKGLSASRISKISATGSTDTSFVTGSGFNSTVYKYHSSGITVGTFTSYNGTSATRIVKLTATGSIDPTFVTGSGLGGHGTDIVTSGSGFVIGGIFNLYNTTFDVNCIVKLTATGSIDPTFVTGTGFIDTTVESLLEDSGNIYAGLSLPLGTYDGNIVTGIVKLSATGSIDTSFKYSEGSGFTNKVRCITKYNSGFLLSGQNLNSGSLPNGNGFNGMLLLTSTGSIDTSFIGPTVSSQNFWKSVITNDNKILTGGDFTTYKGTTVNRIVKLDATGTIDTSFVMGSGFDGPVRDISKSGDDFFVVGDFTTYKGTNVNRIVKLSATDSIITTTTPSINDFIAPSRSPLSSS